MKKIFFAIILAAASLASANAEGKFAPPLGAVYQLCNGSSIGVSFSFSENSVDNARVKFDQRISEIKSAADALGVELVVEKYDYTFTKHHSDFESGEGEIYYILTGSASFETGSSAQALELAAVLNKQKFGTRIYKNSTCGKIKS